MRLFLILFIFFQATAFAALDLELTQGINGAQPVAVIPFSGQNDLSSTNNIAAIIAADLMHSGRFNVSDLNTLPDQPHDIANVKENIWRNKKIDNLVVGKVTAEGNKERVQFQLIDVFANKRKTALVDQVFTVRPNQLRALAHHISDIVYRKLIGHRGVFSTKIAYILVRHSQNQTPIYTLQIADADGYNAHTLLTSHEPIMSPAWSPDAKKIAYVSFERGVAAVYVQKIATGRRNIVSQAPGINGAPAWSPDGKKLALVLSTTGYPKIYSLNLANKKLMQITTGWSLDTEPAWSPDGKSMIFTSNRGGGPQIYRVDLKDGNISRMTFAGNYNARASFSPDGKSIVMLHRDDDLFGIAIQNLVNDQLTPLTSIASGMDESPSMAPNGDMILYASQYEGRGVLGVVSNDGEVKLRLPASKGDVQEPAWSPFIN